MSILCSFGGFTPFNLTDLIAYGWNLGDVRASWNGFCNFDVLRTLERMIHGFMMFSIPTAQHMTQKN